jgi:hypothetical protein
MTSLRQLAIALLGALLAYYEIFRWIPLGRWNWQFHFPVTNDQFYPDLVIGALLLWFLWSFTRQSRPGMITACVLLSLWVVVHLFDWWIPYLRNLPQNGGRYSFYRPHTQLLPVIGHHYPPDAGHAILDLILYPTCLVALFATLKSRSPKTVPIRANPRDPR